MGALGSLFPVLWSLAFLSPLAAIFFAVLFYSVHQRRRPERDRRLPVVAYVVILLVCAIIAFPFGLFFGIGAACSGPGAGNLCGLFGFFVTGPFASSLAMFLVSGVIAALPADEPALLPAGEAGSIRADNAPSSLADETPRDAATWWLRKLWRGEYSLARSFWGFFILGTVVCTIIGMNPVLLFLPGAALAFRLVFLGYQMTAGVGVWRSANAVLAQSGGRASITFADAIKAVAAKAIVVLLIAVYGILLLRTLSILASYSHLESEKRHSWVARAMPGSREAASRGGTSGRADSDAQSGWSRRLPPTPTGQTRRRLNVPSRRASGAAEGLACAAMVRAAIQLST
jgi:hypothetical protein